MLFIPSYVYPEVLIEVNVFFFLPKCLGMRQNSQIIQEKNVTLSCMSAGKAQSCGSGRRA